MNEKIEELYFDPKFPASYSNLSKFYKEAKKKIPKLKLSDVIKWSQKSPAYTTHRPARKTFHRQRILTNDIDYLWEIDLADVSRIKEYNDNNTFLLTCIDTFSKHAWIRPLKRKTGNETTQAFQSILEQSKRIPKKLRYDQGTEFKNKIFQALLVKNGIKAYEATNDTKAAIVERFNRTFKNKMYKYFTANNTLRYVNELQDLVFSYNNTFHRSIKMSPMEVNHSNSKLVRDTLFPNSKKKKRARKPRFIVGDYVRISRKKRMFEKEHAPNWTEEIFRVYKVLNTTPDTYIVEDLLQEIITERIYEQQLQKVELPESFIVRKVHKKRTRKGKKQVLVSWRGYPDKFTQWIPEEDLITLT